MSNTYYLVLGPYRSYDVLGAVNRCTSDIDLTESQVRILAESSFSVDNLRYWGQGPIQVCISKYRYRHQSQLLIFHPHTRPHPSANILIRAAKTTYCYEESPHIHM